MTQLSEPQQGASPPSQSGLRISRILSPFTRIMPHESTGALWLFACVFLILVAYYLVKPVREGWLAVSLFSSLSKLEVKGYSSFLQTVVLIGIMPLYAYYANRWSRVRLLTLVGLFFSTLFPLFWLLRPGFLLDNMPFAGLAFYVWVGIFAVMVIAQFWAYAADLYNEAAGRRLFPFIALGASIGAVAGSWITDRLVKALNLDAYHLLLVAPLPLLVALWIIHHIDRTGHGSARAEKKSLEPAKKGSRGGLRLIFTDRYLFLIALFMLLLNWVVTNGENILFAVVQETLKASLEGLEGESASRILRDATTTFYGRLYFWVNLIGVLLQAFVVSRLLRHGGLTALMLTPPLISLAGYAAISSLGGITALTWGKTAENAVNYSVTNTARHVLWLPVPQEILYKAKTAIDTVCVRLGDVLAALTVLAGVRLMAWNTESFFYLNMALILAWMGVAVAILRERRRRFPTLGKE
ncbi:MAG: hypothetical protein HQL72_14765 [Magnetococcales bacterium]|nr:hypothetical protein [Magnetococcales bacterium]